ncbi:hypothetical protein GOM49_03740 [Clostridium bovifaecis]|uniref:DUF4177 domain-containing protein n=1 Tax=Clostridium bovifaecis TaxID=2184719 RepID=A0A6I6EU20_9CLOT|nr:hypothetical protein GOM49_03740 [Clostridium bovifaecis]
MEKVIWVISNGKMLGAKEDDGLDIVNRYLEEGWKVKHISACALGESINAGQAYIVIEKDVD